MSYQFSRSAEENAACLQRFNRGVAFQMREQQAAVTRGAAEDLRRVQVHLLYTHIQAAIDKAPDAFASVTCDELAAAAMAVIDARS